MNLKEKALSCLIHLRMFPNALFLRVPHKIIRFGEIVKLVQLQATDVILNVGCGIGFQSLIMGKKCKEVVGIDTSKKAISRANSIGAKCQSYISSLFIDKPLESANFSEDCFNKAFSICVLEQIQNCKEVLAEIYRILKPVGCIVLSVDSSEPITSKKLVEKHKREHQVNKYFSKIDTFEKI